MTASKIREVALAHFARNGYEGASLADISSDVGIKKQSIYSHFKGKDELFLAVFLDVVANEFNFIEEYLKRSSSLPLEDFLFGFLLEYKERYAREDDTKFFLRTSFFPPSHLHNKITGYSLEALDRMSILLEPVFESAANSGQIHPDVSIERACGAYTAVLDGMFVEILYGNLERSMKRLDASWYIFWRGVRSIKGDD